MHDPQPPQPRAVTILMADDDPDDRMMTERALLENRLANHVRFVEDGQELMDYLCRSGAYAEPADAPRPGLILLDLNMPRKDGRQALTEIKNSPKLRQIPVVVLTTSAEEQEVLRSYDLGVNSFITKPVSFHQLIAALNVIGHYWLEIVRLPPDPKEIGHGETHPPVVDR